MLLILASFIIILLFSVLIGIGVQKLMGIRRVDVWVTPMLGLGGIMLISAGWSFYGGLGWVFEGFLLGLSIGFAWICKRDFEHWWRELLAEFSFSDNILYPILRIALFLVVLAQCAAAPYLLDNESYYIQTIKWLDTYGTVPGLANIHLFLGQGSGWHYAQAALNFEGLVNRLNDLSGFILLIGGWWSIARLRQYFSGLKDWADLATGIFLVPMIFYAQFIGAPSPDIPVYVMTVVVFRQFVSLWRRPEPQLWTAMGLLVIYMIFIKVTSVVLVLFPLIILLRAFKLYSTYLKAILPIAAIAGLLFLVKNYYFTGHLLFPFIYTWLPAPDWQLPVHVASYFKTLGSIYAYQTTPEGYATMSLTERYTRWLSLPGLHGYFHKLLSITIVAIPIVLVILQTRLREVISKRTDFHLMWCLYSIFLVQSIILLITSPQYRFYFNLLMMVWLIVGAFILYRIPKLIKPILLVCIVAPLGVLLMPAQLGSLTRNPYMQESVSLHPTQILLPYPKTRYPVENYSSTIHHGIQFYYHPDFDFFYGTGDAPLPAVNPRMLDYMSRYFYVYPELRSKNIGDGFRSTRVPSENEE